MLQTPSLQAQFLTATHPRGHRKSKGGGNPAPLKWSHFDVSFSLQHGGNQGNPRPQGGTGQKEGPGSQQLLLKLLGAAFVGDKKAKMEQAAPPAPPLGAPLDDPDSRRGAGGPHAPPAAERGESDLRTRGRRTEGRGAGGCGASPAPGGTPTGLPAARPEAPVRCGSRGQRPGVRPGPAGTGGRRTPAGPAATGRGGGVQAAPRGR